MGERKNLYKWFVCVDIGKLGYDYTFDILTEEELEVGDKFRMQEKVYKVESTDKVNYTLEVKDITGEYKVVNKLLT